jgi:hypothetical protein
MAASAMAEADPYKRFEGCSLRFRWLHSRRGEIVALMTRAGRGLMFRRRGAVALLYAYAAFALPAITITQGVPSSDCSAIGATWSSLTPSLARASDYFRPCYSTARASSPSVIHSREKRISRLGVPDANSCFS